MSLADDTTTGIETATPTANTAHFDVIIVGAGISGIDAAYHLQKMCPGKTFTLLERQESFGGTWRTHRYPGIRSDSDLFTFGFGWKPWVGPPIASASEILKYLDEVLDEEDIRRHIRYSQTVKAAQWSSEEALWRLTVETADGLAEMTCHFLWMCQGYYRHTEGYTPDFPGADRFRGRIVHPQTWPEDLDYAGKKVVVIGSGATAATVIPAMAGTAGHITMLQRSPTYFSAIPNRYDLANTMRTLGVPEVHVHEAARQKVLADGELIAWRSFHDPDGLKADLFTMARAYLGDDFDMTPFTPSYRPWQQRLAVIPDGDMFRAIRAGQASVVTDTIKTFDQAGIQLSSGRHLDADIIVTATGFNLCALGDIAFTVDGEPREWANSISWHSTLFTGFPNMAWVFGYLRTSWTVRADMIADLVCRLLNHMDARGADQVVPELRAEDADMRLGPFVTDENFSAGYLQRLIHILPKQGDRGPWLNTQDYYYEKDVIPSADLEDGTLVFSSRVRAHAAE